MNQSGRWEYCQVTWVAKSAEEMSNIDLEFFPGRVAQSDKGEKWIAQGSLRYFSAPDESEVVNALTPAIALLGQEGWELVSHIEITTPRIAQVYTFKRPLTS